MDFWQNGRGHREVMEFHFFGPEILCCLKTGKILQVVEQKYVHKSWVFSISDAELAHVQSCESALLNFKKLDQKLEVHFF